MKKYLSWWVEIINVFICQLFLAWPVFSFQTDDCNLQSKYYSIFWDQAKSKKKFGTR